MTTRRGVEAKEVRNFTVQIQQADGKTIVGTASSRRATAKS
jgi:hypothetical protein